MTLSRWALSTCLWWASFVAVCAQGFVNFETIPVHPVELSPDGLTLAVCNLPDYRLELFNVSSGSPSPIGSVPVGVDPVTVRFRTSNEVWVVNHISSSISIVELAGRQVVATLATQPGPADLVFAGIPQRAFVSCARDNSVQVFDPTTRQLITTLAIDGDRPRAMAVSAEGLHVYVAVFESGNASTILAPQITTFRELPEPAAVESLLGPYGGNNPPPNSGLAFDPPLNGTIPTNIAPPKVSHIVKRNAAGRWLDDNAADWTEFVSGTNAALSGRVPGWDMADHDLAIIDTVDYYITYATGLMNLCMAVATHPTSGKVMVVGTDATNERRFEPKVRSTFVRVHAAVVDPATREKTIQDLNPHLDYIDQVVPVAVRDQSLGDPRGIIWKSDGSRGYVSGMGSRNIVALQGDGTRLNTPPIDVQEGPTGMAWDEQRQRLYVLNSFSASVSVIETINHSLLTNVALHDPTPATIHAGRRHFYDTRRNSGLGQVSCASCHPDGRMDRLAWDLGNPAGTLLNITVTDIFGGQYPRTYHPMKGPMVTQTLQDIIGHEPFHWRGDRVGIENFNPAFPDLLGRDLALTDQEMAEFKAFLRTLQFPPNPLRQLDDSLSTNVPLTTFNDPADPESSLPDGNARRGRELFFTAGGDVACIQCHQPPSGVGPDDPNSLPGTNGARHHQLISNARSGFLPFKGPQLRNLADKVGLDFQRSDSRAGFGFTHDGRVDTLPRFLHLSFDRFGEASTAQNIADLTAFLLSFAGSDPALSTTAQPIPAGDVASAVGKQITITTPTTNALLNTMLFLAGSPSNRVDLVAKATVGNQQRGWYFGGSFLSDRDGEEITLNQLLALATPETPVTFTVVARGTGQRTGIDRDGDGWFDRTEMEQGFNPTDPQSHGANRAPQLLISQEYRGAHPGMIIAVPASGTDLETPAQNLIFSLAPGAPAGASIDQTGLVQWSVPASDRGYVAPIFVRVSDGASPPKMDFKRLAVEVVPLRIKRMQFEPFDLGIYWDAVPGTVYRLQVKTSLTETAWSDWYIPTTANSAEAVAWDASYRDLVHERFFRVRVEP